MEKGIKLNPLVNSSHYDSKDVDCVYLIWVSEKVRRVLSYEKSATLFQIVSTVVEVINQSVYENSRPLRVN